MDQMDNMFELTPTTDTPSSSFNNNPPLSSASTSNNALLPSLPSSSNSASRGHGPIFDIASFMEESRQRQEARDREETEAAEENTLRLRTVRQTMVVPGESTSSPSSDQLSEEEWSSSTRRRRRRRSATGSDDQAVSDVSHPLSVTHSHTLREAALDCPSTTDSEPDQLLPGTKYESTKYQRVPTVKKHVLEKQRRDLEQTQEYVEKISSKTKLKATPPSSQDSKTSGSSDYIASAQSGLSCSLESTSSTTVQETDEGSQDADCTLDRSHGLFKFKGRIVTKFDHNTDNREPMTDAEIIDSVATIAEEGTQDLFSVNDANNDSQYERTNTVPRWMLQQQKEQESEQTDLEELTEETQRGEKRSRLDSSPSSGTDPTLSPTMKPPTKRPAGRIQSDSSCNSNES
ncbi:PREDICTED: uncharacterized protein LOC109588673 [Amphimedon queenslandica]|uniref:Uncharacterized protein n=1 Tax=Amphimedon queenslandica TaxID=400682 RepID=A0AAN0JTK2_AMPQE|nr:PREDICTED: uncharacterized protein LOC109588673 [Amphimedon queenslandica]|eukprot:XP_019860371.1 PREDICTED: uncharacterized protein LOC109588673 [Amphimedon queenslandica]